MQIYHYHPATGEYLGTGMADESPLEPGVWLVPANATTSPAPASLAGKVRVWTGSAWAYQDVQDEAQPLDPEFEPSLADLKAAKLAAIQTGKNAVKDGGFVHEGVLFDSDSEARLAYLELSTKLIQNPAYSTPWKASTGVWVTMDAALFLALQPAYEAHISACFAWQAAREMEVAAAQTAAAVQVIADTI